MSCLTVSGKFFAYDVVGYRRKVIVPQTDGVKRRRPDRADEFVDDGFQQAAGFGGAHGNGHGDSGRIELAQREDGDAHGVARGDAVIDQNDRPIRYGWGGASISVEGFPSIQFLGRDRHLGRDGFRREASFFDQHVVEELNSSGRNRTHRDFRLIGEADFAHDKNVQMKSERFRDFRADRDAASRKSEDERFFAVGVMGERLDEGLTCRRTVPEAVNVGEGGGGMMDNHDRGISRSPMGGCRRGQFRGRDSSERSAQRTSAAIRKSCKSDAERSEVQAP